MARVETAVVPHGLDVADGVAGDFGADACDAPGERGSLHGVPRATHTDREATEKRGDGGEVGGAQAEVRRVHRRSDDLDEDVARADRRHRDVLDLKDVGGTVVGGDGGLHDPRMRHAWA